MVKKKFDFPLLKNLLTTVEASAGSNMFRRLYASHSPAKDILRDGDLSCAYYASSVLKLFNLIGGLHATVDGAVRDLERHHWRRIRIPKPGAILVWAPRRFKNGELHRHIGFFIGNGRAISNSSARRSPQLHAWNYRPVEAIFWNSKLK